MTEDNDMTHEELMELMGEAFARIANVERLAIKANEALIAFLPNDASEELMENLIDYTAALKSMPIFQKQAAEAARMNRETNVETH